MRAQLALHVLRRRIPVQPHALNAPASALKGLLDAPLDESCTNTAPPERGTHIQIFDEQTRARHERRVGFKNKAKSGGRLIFGNKSQKSVEPLFIPPPVFKEAFTRLAIGWRQMLENRQFAQKFKKRRSIFALRAANRKSVRHPKIINRPRHQKQSAGGTTEEPYFHSLSAPLK